MTDPGLAVCLSSSFFGYYAHAGFLGGLERHGIRPGRISGCSAGAIAGGLWAAGIRGERLKEVIFSLWFRRCFFDLGFFRRFPGVLTWSYASGLLSGKRMERFLTDLIGDLRMEECDPRIEISVANLTRLCGEIRDHGVLRDFIIASFSMPLIYRPRRIGGEEFLDGGVSNGTPFDHWIHDPSIHTIIVHGIRHPQSGFAGSGPGHVIAACHALVSQELFELRRREAEASGKRVIFLETLHDRPGILHRRHQACGYFHAGELTAAECAGKLAASSTSERLARR